GLGQIDDSDILLFTPGSLGANTAGTWAMYFDGSDVGLTTDPEDIDGLAELPDGRLLIGTRGFVSVPGLQADDKDVLAFTPTMVGPNTAGTWSLYSMGAAVDLTTAEEDVRGFSQTPGNHFYWVVQDSYTVNTVSGTSTDVLYCQLTGFGTQTRC